MFYWDMAIERQGLSMQLISPMLRVFAQAHHIFKHWVNMACQRRGIIDLSYIVCDYVDVLYLCRVIIC
jgi:hypothetical protein